MKWHRVLAAVFFALPLMATGASAQQGFNSAPVTADEGRPAEIASAKSSEGFVYTDSHGLTLYALNPRIAGIRFGGAGAGGPTASGVKYCDSSCAQTWIAIKAPADAKPIGAWRVVEGAEGPQWAYKGDPVFTYVGDKSTGTVAGKGKDFLWRALNYIPPAPVIVAPAPVTSIFNGENYVLEDGQGHALFTSDKPMADAQPFMAGMAYQGVGNWTVSRQGDHTQWAYRGHLVYASSAKQPPAGVSALQPDESETKAGLAKVAMPERAISSAQ